HFLRGRVEGRIQVPRGPAIALELSDHVHVVVEFVEGLLHPFLLLAQLRSDPPDVNALRSPDHVEDLGLEFGERTSGEGGEEERDVARADVPYAAVQEASLEDVPGRPPPRPFLVVEGRRVVPDVEDHTGLEERVEEVVEGLDLPELFLQEESLHLRLVEDLAGLALPLEALEVPREHELELLIHEEVARGDDALRFEVAQDLFDELRLEAEGHRELRRAVRPVHIEPLREDLVERLFERSPNGLARRIDGLLDASARHQVRPFELPQGLVQRILLPFRLPKEFLVGDLRELSSEVLDDLSRLELDRTDLVRGHHALQDLAVQLPQEGGAVLHEDQVRDALQDDVVGERRGQRSEVALRHRDFPRLD